jgi:putative glutamine amidotransferase
VVYREIARLQPYLAALGAAGLDPVPVAAGPAVSLSDCDGLVLVGGSDVDPMRYGEARRPETEEPDKARDAAELTLLEHALERDLPVLAICRGLQLLNVFHGGSLIQHLNPVERHQRADGDHGLPAHAVTIVPNTLLSTIAGAPTWQVNSRHHQAVKTVGKALRVSAVDAEDGTVEALERPDKRFVLAVQWHPEDQAPRDPEQAKIFQSFAAAVTSTAKSTRTAADPTYSRPAPGGSGCS